MKRGLLCLVGAWMGLWLALAVQPARAQNAPFRFTPPQSYTAHGVYRIPWSGLGPVAVDKGFTTSVTWYYCKDSKFSDLHRLVTSGGYHDDFRDFRRNWDAIGDFAYDWRLHKEQGRHYLSGSAHASPLLSVSEMHPLSPRDARDSVVSLLLRPTAKDGKNHFGIQLRSHEEGGGPALELRQEGDNLCLYENDKPVTNQPVCCSVHLIPGQWYWLEVGLRTKHFDIECRVQVFDEERHTRLAMATGEFRPSIGRLCGPGSIGLFGSADFADLYVDPWKSRWDNDEDAIHWDTSDVPDGDYYLVAEVVSDRQGDSKPRFVSSGYQVHVRNSSYQAASNH